MKKALFIAPGYFPYTFSENLCNGKLVYALQKSGWKVDVISKIDEGPTYSAEWQEPWMELKPHSYEVTYPVGNKLERICDLVYSALKMGYPLEGIRWARRAYQKAVALLEKNHYDAVFTRSPNDIPHIVGYQLKKKYGIQWIANWNDPSATIWPEPYTHHFSPRREKMLHKYTVQCLKAADINTFPSQSLLDHYIQHFPFLKNQHTQVIPHIALYDGLFESYPKEKGTNLRMCHSGNMSVERDPELLFSAMRRLIDEGQDKIQLDIMGHTNSFVEGLVNKYHLANNVHFLGGFPYMEAVHKLLDYDVLVLLEAKLEKGIFFASKFTDYAQASRPILAISPKIGFAADMLQKYGGGFSVNNEKQDEIYSGLKHLYGLWEENKLATTYQSEKLFEQFSAQHVVELYNLMKI